MADADFDVLVAPGTQVLLGRLERMDDAEFDVLRYRGIRAHRMSAAATRKAAATYT